MVTMVGFGYSYFQKHSNNNGNNFNGIDIMNIDKAKIKLKNGKNMTIVYGLIDKSNYNLNHPFNIVRVLDSCLVSIYATHNHINSISKNESNM